MKTLDPQFQFTLFKEVTAIAWCWKIERKDSVVHGFTSFDLKFLIDDVEYHPFTGFTPTADTNSEGLENNNSQDLTGLLTFEQVGQYDLIKGIWDGAKVTCFQVDVTDLPTSLEEELPKFSLVSERYIKRTIQSDIGFRFEMRDFDALLDTPLGKLTSKFCDRDLGDAGCGVDLTPYTFITTVTSIANRYTFNIDGDFTAEQFTRGKIGFLTGHNQDIVHDVARFNDGNEVILWQPLPYSIEVGDEVEIVQGCSKTLYDCVVRYDNAINSDSEPHLPTTDQVMSPPIERYVPNPPAIDPRDDGDDDGEYEWVDG